MQVSCSLSSPTRPPAPAAAPARTPPTRAHLLQARGPDHVLQQHVGTGGALGDLGAAGDVAMVDWRIAVHHSSGDHHSTGGYLSCPMLPSVPQHSSVRLNQLPTVPPHMAAPWHPKTTVLKRQTPPAPCCLLHMPHPQGPSLQHPLQDQPHVDAVRPLGAQRSSQLAPAAAAAAARPALLLLLLVPNARRHLHEPHKVVIRG